jgi:small-conductance mechanosensitive channel
MVRSTHSLFLLVASLELGSSFLALPPDVREFLRRILVAALLLQSAGWGLSLIDYLLTRRLLAGQPENEARTTRNAMILVAKIAVWSLVLLLVLQNATGIKVDALLASLGIAGVAVALAVQNILGDLFSSLSIALDRPFVIGDAIKVGTMSGTVEKIGLKSTRLRSLDGEQLIFSNADLLSSRIQNFQRMERRRAMLTLGVDYVTPVEKLAAIPEMLKEIVAAQPQTAFDRAHAKTLGDFAILYELVYFMETPDLRAFMDVQQAVILAVLARFEKEGIRMPFPTQNLLIQRPQGDPEA